MAGLDLAFKDGVTPVILKLVNQFPDMAKEYLGRLGYRGTEYLKDELLSGQELNLQKYPTDSRGHRTVRHTVNRRGTLGKIFAYPLNLFEKGRTLRSGKREAGKYILTRKLKAIMASRAQTDADYISNQVFEAGFKRMGA